MINRALGGKAKVEDFMPNFAQFEDSSIEAAMSELVGAANPKRK